MMMLIKTGARRLPRKVDQARAHQQHKAENHPLGIGKMSFFPRSEQIKHD
jgi:hypothetical protein